MRHAPGLTTHSLGNSTELVGARQKQSPLRSTDSARAGSIASWDLSRNGFLLVPILLFVVALFIRPTVNFDSGFGLLAFRGMLNGGDFNFVPAPDPTDLARDVETFLSWWTPGQYLAPGAFVWLGADYGLAVSLTTLIATLVGLSGWLQLARSFAASPFVILVFAFGLVSVRHVTLGFQNYNGGEVLLFAVAPWSLQALRWAVDRSAAVCLAISLLCAALLFFAKLTGLVVFAANILAISLIEVVRRRRITVSLLAMWIASVSSAALFIAFWHSRGEIPAGGSEFAFTWAGLWFPVAGAALSGVSGLDLLSWLASSPADLVAKTLAIGPFSAVLMGWVWVRLRHTRYRRMAVCLFAVIGFYVAAVAALYFRGAPITFHERHLRYAGILFLLLFLVAIDQFRLPIKALGAVFVGVFAAYGLTSYALGALELTRARSDHALSSGVSQQIVPPVVLEYLRAEAQRNHWSRPIAVLPSTEAAMDLPGFRIIVMPLEFPVPEMISARSWAGKAEKIFVVVQEKMVANGKAAALLRCFVDYAFEAWSETRMGNMVVYSQ